MDGNETNSVSKAAPGVNAKQAGYLRMAPASHKAPIETPAAPVTKMWNKLAKQGLIDVSKTNGMTLFKRTPAGDDALRMFDEGIRMRHELLLDKIQAGDAEAGAVGVAKLIDAGLVHMPSIGGHYEPRLTRDGEALVGADPAPSPA